MNTFELIKAVSNSVLDRIAGFSKRFSKECCLLCPAVDIYQECTSEFIKAVYDAVNAACYAKPLIFIRDSDIVLELLSKLLIQSELFLKRVT